MILSTRQGEGRCIDWMEGQGEGQEGGAGEGGGEEGV